MTGRYLKFKKPLKYGKVNYFTPPLSEIQCSVLITECPKQNRIAASRRMTSDSENTGNHLKINDHTTKNV